MKKQIKVLQVGLSDHVGGIEKVVDSWYKRLPSDIHFDFTNTSARKLAFEQTFTEGGSKIYRIPSRKADPGGSYRALKYILSGGDYDYLQFHAMSLSWPEPILIAGRSKRTQGIIHSHMVVDRHMAVKYRLMHAIGKLCLSKVEYHEVACGADAGKSMFGNDLFTVIPNGIELGRFRFCEGKRKDIRKKYHISDSTYVIGHVGRPGAQKNYPFIFRTFFELLKNGCDCRLLLLGNIERDPQIQGLMNQYSCKQAVVFTGYVKDTSAYYSAMDCFFFPSLYEGFSVSLIEAQAAGLPCIVSGNISSESKICGDFSFVSLRSDTAAAEELIKYSKIKKDRKERSIELSFDIRNTANKMFDYYREHRKQSDGWQ